MKRKTVLVELNFLQGTVLLVPDFHLGDPTCACNECQSLTVGKPRHRSGMCLNGVILSIIKTPILTVS